MGKAGSITLDFRLPRPLLPFSIIIVYIYLMLLIFFEGYSDNNSKMELAMNCSCIHKDRDYIRGIFWGFTGVWWLAVILTVIFHIFRFL